MFSPKIKRIGSKICEMKHFYKQNRDSDIDMHVLFVILEMSQLGCKLLLLLFVNYQL